LRRLACLPAAVLLSPPAQAEPLQSQDQPKSKVVTLSGIAVNPDGSPAAELAVEIKAPNKQLVGTGGAGGGGGGQAPPPELLSQDKKQQNDFITLGKGTTDSEGKFSIKFEHKDVKVYQLEIGNKMETAWIVKPLENKGKDADLGKVQLREKVS
jgi:hypothetical protein